MNTPLRLSRTRAGLLIVDIQENLLPAMHEHARVLRNAVILARVASLLGRPVQVTEQYRKGLGPTIRELADAVPALSPVEKLSFSACNGSGVVESFRQHNLEQVILCGIEAHVCVMQSCLDLLQEQFEVFVVADAISSRAQENCQLAANRMQQSGAALVSTEMVVFELLGRAGTEEFKKILPLVK